MAMSALLVSLVDQYLGLGFHRPLIAVMHEQCLWAKFAISDHHSLTFARHMDATAVSRELGVFMSREKSQDMMVSWR